MRCSQVVLLDAYTFRLRRADKREFIESAPVRGLDEDVGSSLLVSEDSSRISRYSSSSSWGAGGNEVSD